VAFANINYSSCKIEGQSEDKGLAKRYGKFASAIKEIEILESIFVDNLITYQSEEATRDKFMSLSKETKILHISTHGFFDKGMLKDLNKINPNVDAAGENIFKSCGLLLSGYNDDKTKYLSAYDVINQDFSGVDFVFLSACDSGMGKVLSRGDYSLVSAFKISGAKNIIAILSPINEDVATKFAGFFYDLISRGLSYHEAFYETSHKVALKNGTIILIE
jgi:CHAT domain-containing protein